MRKFLLISFLLLLSACQPSAKENKPDGASENSKPATTQQSESITGKDSSTVVETELSSPMVLAETPYDIVESNESCDEPIVIEFFAYQCPHCYTLEKKAAEWKLKNKGKVKFLPVPTHLGHQEFGSFLIVHHAAVRLGVIDLAMPKLFDRLHEQKKTFSSQDDAVDFLVSLGVDKEKAVATLSDEEAGKNDIEKSFSLLTKYKVASVPMLLVNHRYLFGVTKAGGYDKVFDVVDETLKLPSNCSK